MKRQHLTSEILLFFTIQSNFVNPHKIGVENLYSNLGFAN